MPLTEEMLTYAREDTHYLLYIYDRIKVDLAQHGWFLHLSISKAVSDLGSFRLSVNTVFTRQDDREGRVKSR